MTPRPRRILALDLGTRRIGLALSDGLGLTAQGLDTLIRRNKRADLAALASIVREREVELIVVGLPLRLNGDAGTQAVWATEFAALLRQALGVPVTMRDERLTSVEAELMLRGRRVPPNQRKAAIDRLAATILLQEYLDSLEPTGAPS